MIKCSGCAQAIRQVIGKCMADQQTRILCTGLGRHTIPITDEIVECSRFHSREYEVPDQYVDNTRLMVREGERIMWLRPERDRTMWIGGTRFTRDYDYEDQLHHEQDQLVDEGEGI